MLGATVNLYAQSAGLGSFSGGASPGQASQPDSLVSVVADSLGLPAVPLADLPMTGATYYWVIPGGMAIPTPCLPLDWSGNAYEIAPGIFVLDDSGGQISVNPRRFGLPANSTAALVVAAEVQSLTDQLTQIQTTDANEMARSFGKTAGIHGFAESHGDDGSGAFTSFNPYPTNGIWLEMVGVTNGLAYFKLHCVPNLDFVYQILSCENLSGCGAQPRLSIESSWSGLCGDPINSRGRYNPCCAARLPV